MKEQNQEIEIIFNGDISFEKQLEKIKEVNNIFVDIAANYHIEAIKKKKEKSPLVD